MLGTSKSINGFDVRTVPGCVLWLDASQDTTPVGSYVTTLPDRSGNGNDLVPTEANILTRSKSGPQGQAVYNFAGTRATRSNFSWQTSFTQFVVVRTSGGSWFTTNGSGTVGYVNYVLSGNWDLIYVGQTFGTVDPESSVYHTTIFNATPQGATGWQLFCIGYTAGSTVVTNYTLNGIVRTASSGSAFSGLQQSYPLWLNGRWDYAFDTSYVAEFIHFNSSLTIDQRQQVEGYLAWKWGLEYTPSVTQVSAVIPTAATGCLLWLDGADRTTILNGTSAATSSGTVTSWLDKSGNNNTATTGGTVATTTLVANGINFTGNSYMSVPGLANTLVNTPFVVFAVETYAGGNNRAIFGDGIEAGTNATLHILYRNSGDITMAFYGNDLEYSVSGTGTMRLWTFYLPASTNRNIRLNGNLVATHTNSTRLTSFQLPSVGRAEGDGNYYNGTISELIVFNVDLGIPAIQQMENYLLAKWNLVQPPPSRPLAVSSPVSVPGCGLWLDGADASTLTLSGSNVTTWHDKSGKNNTATTQSGSSAIKKISTGLSFDGGGYMYVPGIAGTLVNTPFVIFVVETLSSTGSRWFFGDDGSPGAAGSFLSLGYRSPTNASFSLWYNELEDYAVAGTGSTRVWCFYLPTASNRVIRRNGVVDVTADNYNRLSTFTTPVIGHFWSNTDVGYKGTISEIIVYPNDPGLPAIQRVEAYLMNKWQLNGSIASVPGSIPGMSLWLDGADPNGNGSTKVDGSAVSTWVDKSGSGNNGTISYGTVTYTALTQSMLFNSSWFQVPDGTISPGASTFTIFVVCRPTGLANYPYVYFAGTPGYDTATALIFYPDGQVENGFYTDFMGKAPAGTVLINETYLFSSAYNGTSRTLYMNGSPIVTGSPGGTKNVGTGNNYIGGGGGNPFIGTISEMIVFNRTLSDSDRQSVDSYLTAKWNVPRTSLSRGPVTSVPGCMLWLDGADPLATGKAPANGTAISTWADKSGNGRNAINTSEGALPVYTAGAFNGISTLVFSDDPMITRPASVVSPNNTLSVFVVINPTSSRAPTYNTDFLYIESNYAAFDLFLDTNSALQMAFRDTGRYIAPSSMIMNKSNLVSIISDGTTLTIYLNGNSMYSGAVGSGTSTLNLSSSWWVGTAGYTGPLCEILMYPVALSTGQRQSVESYLSVKWGLTALPYTPLLTAPTLLPGCQLWLDGSDPAGSGVVPANGTNVSKWVDKSGYGNSPVASAGSYPVYSSNIKSVTWNGTANSQLIFPTSIANAVVGTAFTVFMVEQRTKGGNTDNFILRGTAQSTNSNLLIGTNSPSTIIRFAFYGNDLDLTIPDYAAGEPSILGCYQYSKPGRKIYKNGFLGSTDGNTSDLASWAGASIGGNVIFGSYAGNVYEIIIYNYALTTPQRQSVERYLAKKWGIQNTIYDGVPGQIPGCQLWLDGADQTTLTLSGSSVTTWKDKSGNGNNGTASGSITYNSASSGLVFTGSQRFQIPDNAVPIGDTAFTYFFVFNSTTAVSGPGLLGCGTMSYGQCVSLRNGNNGTATMQVYWNGYDLQTNFNYTLNVNQIVCLTYTGNAGVESIYINGKLGVSSSPGVRSQTSGPNYIGTTSAYEFWQGQIMEALCFSSSVSTSQRQTVEAYLAKKWGVTTTTEVLPTTHPFLTLKPQSRGLLPVDLPTCQLWLDAADNSSILDGSTPVTTNNHTFTVWNDKSGNARNMAVTDGTFTYNNKAAVSTGSGYLLNQVPVDLTQFTAFFVATPVAGGDQTVMHVISTNGGSGYNFSDSFAFYIDGVLNSRFYARGTGEDTYATNLTRQASVPKLFTFQTNGTTLSSWIDGTSMKGRNITFPGVRTGTAQGFSIGVDWGARSYRTLRSPIHEVIIYNSVITDTQRQQIEGYLTKKWKINLATPRVFTYTGGDQLWVCPPGVTSVTFHAWGAAGGFAQSGGVVGGAGAYMTGTLAVTPGNSYAIVVGAGGPKANSAVYYVSPALYGGGGTGRYAGGGGGYSGIFRNAQVAQGYALVVVGGGGGAGPDYGSDVGGSATYTGTAQSGGTNSSASAGGGGTTSGGGAGGNGNGNGNGDSGGVLSGGNGAHYGGGGGAGYWGGGGGGAYVSGGGGGSSYYNSSYVSSVSGADALSGSGVQYLAGPGNANQYWQYPVATSMNWFNGGNGLVVIIEDTKSHPYASVPPTVPLPFSPMNFAGCQVWNDASQLTSVSGTFPNLAGNAYSVACTGTLKLKGKHGLNTVTLSTSQSWTVSPTPSMSTYTMFWVGRQTGGNNGRILNSVDGYNQLYGYWNGYKKQLYISGDPSYLGGYSSDTNWDMFSHSRTSGGAYTMNWNGSALYSGSSSTGNPLHGLTINAGDYGEQSDCEVAEIILYNVLLTPAQIAQVEGYLAQKWGFQMPVAHPYYSIPPAKSIKKSVVYGAGLYMRFYYMSDPYPAATVGGFGWGGEIGSPGPYMYSSWADQYNSAVYRIPRDDQCGIYMKGYYYSPTADTVQFYTVSDDGIKVVFNGVAVIDNWTLHGPTGNESSTISVAAGSYTPIYLIFYEWGGGAICELNWRSSSTSYTYNLSGRFFYDTSDP